MSFMHFDSTTTGSQLADHNTTITVGNDVVASYYTYPYGPTFPVFHQNIAYGFDAGADWWINSPNFGSIANPNFNDGTLIARTILSAYYSSAFVQWVISGTDVPDFDTTFKGITVNGNFIPRSSRTNYYADTSAGSNGVYGGGIGFPGTTCWTWGTFGNVFGTSGTIPFVVNIV